jgi:tRNA-2-methylthio-N6-dimethylallyladenosine synthase
MAARQSGRRVVVTGFPEHGTYDLDAISRSGAYKGMITVIEGCNKKCTFCIVPTTRGPERCRPMADILREVHYLLDYGFVEIELLGQTINHWREPGNPSRDFADLLAAVAAVPNLERLRFITSYPRDFSPRMVEQVGRNGNICPYLHLPVQSGSNGVLRRMGRGYSVEDYRSLVEELRAARPGLALSTDIIVGFPGERDEDFAATLRLVEEVRFASLYAFVYSPRPGTAALNLTDGLPRDIATTRLQELLRRQESIQLEQNNALVGEELDIVVTGRGKDPGTLNGRTSCHRVVVFPAGSAVSLGQVERVRITKAQPHSLLARPIGKPVRAGCSVG